MRSEEAGSSLLIGLPVATSNLWKCTKTHSLNYSLKGVDFITSQLDPTKDTRKRKVTFLIPASPVSGSHTHLAPQMTLSQPTVANISSPHPGQGPSFLPCSQNRLEGPSGSKHIHSRVWLAFLSASHATIPVQTGRQAGWQADRQTESSRETFFQNTLGVDTLLFTWEITEGKKQAISLGPFPTFTTFFTPEFS